LLVAEKCNEAARHQLFLSGQGFEMFFNLGFVLQSDRLQHVFYAYEMENFFILKSDFVVLFKQFCLQTD